MKYLWIAFAVMLSGGAAYADIPLSYSDDEPPLPFYDTPYVVKEQKKPSRSIRRRSLPQLSKHAELSRDVRERAEHLAARIFGDDGRNAAKIAVPPRPPQAKAAVSAVPDIIEEETPGLVSVDEAVKTISAASGVVMASRSDDNGRGSYIEPDSIETLIRNGLDEEIDGAYLLSVGGLSTKRGYFVRLIGDTIHAETEYTAVDAGRGRFEASVIFRTGGNFERVVFRGRAEPAATVYAPAEAIPKDTVVTHDMLEETIVSEKAAASFLKEDDIVGKSAARMLRPGRAIRTRDVRSPLLVKRNAVIDVEYQAPGVLLRTTAQASENGAKGDIIRARNITGDKVIYAQITGVNQARAVEQQ